MRQPECEDTPNTMSSGRTGTRSSARPVAARIAATIAGVLEIVGGSPTPFAPYGASGCGNSMRSHDHRWHVEHRREQVIGERRVPHRAVLQLDLFHHGEAEALRDAALQLADDRERIDRLADILRGRDLHDLHQTGVHVHVDDGTVRREKERDMAVVLGRVVALLASGGDGA